MTPPGARALFVFHAALFTYWAGVQIYFRLFAKHVSLPALTFGLLSWALITAALVLFTRFALGQRGTRAAGFAMAAAALALVDFVAETLQFAPQLGFPALLPSDGQLPELFLRSAWASSEFAMRGAMFMALWLNQTGADKRVRSLFFGLILVHWVIAMVSFVSVTEPYEAFWSTQKAALLVLKLSPFIGLTWLAMLVWLNHRVVRDSVRS